MQESNAEIFLNKYREFENNIRKRYHVPSGNNDSPIYMLKKRREFESLINEIDMCKDARNMLSHRPKIDNSYPVLPSESLIKVLDKLNECVINPPKVDSIMVRSQNIFAVQKDNLVRFALKEMIAKVYTHVPVLDDGHVVGCFSEDTLLSLFSKDDIVMIDESMTFEDESIRDLLPLGAHKTESFRFVSKKTTIFEIKELFRKAVLVHDRIGLVFVTQNGKPNERILGMITSWDIPRGDTY